MKPGNFHPSISLASLKKIDYTGQHSFFYRITKKSGAGSWKKYLSSLIPLLLAGQPPS